MAALKPDFRACRQQKCVRSVAKSVEMMMKGGKDRNVGSFRGQNADSVFSGAFNQAIMPLKIGG